MRNQDDAIRNEILTILNNDGYDDQEISTAISKGEPGCIFYRRKRLGLKRNNHKNIFKKIEKTCKFCNEKFIGKSIEKYCESCKILVKREQIKKWNKENKRKGKTNTIATKPHSCIICGKPCSHKNSVCRDCFESQKGVCKRGELVKKSKRKAYPEAVF